MADGSEPTQESEALKAERRMRDEMARHRHAEAAQLRSLKIGCIGIIVAVVVAMMILFVFF